MKKLKIIIATALVFCVTAASAQISLQQKRAMSEKKQRAIAAGVQYPKNNQASHPTVKQKQELSKAQQQANKIQKEYENKKAQQKKAAQEKNKTTAKAVEKKSENKVKAVEEKTKDKAAKEKSKAKAVEEKTKDKAAKEKTKAKAVEEKTKAKANNTADKAKKTSEAGQKAVKQSTDTVKQAAASASDTAQEKIEGAAAQGAVSASGQIPNDTAASGQKELENAADDPAGADPNETGDIAEEIATETTDKDVAEEIESGKIKEANDPFSQTTAFSQEDKEKLNEQITDYKK